MLADEAMRADEKLLVDSEAAVPMLRVAAPDADLSSPPLSECGCVLVRLRLSRRRLLASLRRRMLDAAAKCDEDEDAGKAALACLAAAASHPPAVYPGLDALPIEELASWEGRAWDWEHMQWAS